MASLKGDKNKPQKLRELILPGQSFEAVKSFARYLDNSLSDLEYYKCASIALLACLKDEASADRKKLEYWNKEEKESFYQKLILQETSDSRHHQFLLALASHQSSGEKWVFPAIANEISLTLQNLCSQNSLHKNSILCLLLLREFISGWISQNEISALHIAHFGSFSMEDLSLPYSCLFESSVYHRNATDLKKLVTSINFKEKVLSGLKFYHILLIEWLSGEKIYLYSSNKELFSVIENKLKKRRGKFNPDEVSAAKFLIIRHISEKLDPQCSKMKSLIEVLGATESFIDFMESIWKIRKQLNETIIGKPRTLLKKLMNNKAYQSIQIAKSLTERHLALPFSFKKRLRVAICISGQLRGYRQAFDFWKKSLLTGADFDIYVHSWKQVGRSGAEPFRSVLPFAGDRFQSVYRQCCSVLGFDEVKKLYPTLFCSLQQTGTVDIKELMHFYGTEHVVLEDGDNQLFKEFSNSQKMHYKISACHELAMSQGIKYDLIVRARPDLPLSYRGFSWNDIFNCCRSEPMLFSDSKLSVHYMSLMMGDQFAISSPEGMSIYANTWNTYPLLAENNLCRCPANFEGHLSLAMVCWSQGLIVEKIPVKKLDLLDPEPLLIKSSLESIQGDSASRNFSWDQKLIEALKLDLKE